MTAEEVKKDSNWYALEAEIDPGCTGRKMHFTFGEAGSQISGGVYIDPLLLKEHGGQVNLILKVGGKV